MGRKQTECRKRLLFYLTGSLIVFFAFNACSYLGEHHRKAQVYKHLDRAKELAANGYWWQAVSEQEKALKISPFQPPGDQVLYEMALLMIDPKNREQDYHKSLKLFRQLIRVFPQSKYRSETEIWIFVLSDYTELNDRLKKNERDLKTLQDNIVEKEQIIQRLKEQRTKMKQIDLELNKKRELTSPGEE